MISQFVSSQNSCLWFPESQNPNKTRSMIYLPPSINGCDQIAISRFASSCNFVFDFFESLVREMMIFFHMSSLMMDGLNGFRKTNSCDPFASSPFVTPLNSSLWSFHPTNQRNAELLPHVLLYGWPRSNHNFAHRELEQLCSLTFLLCESTKCWALATCPPWWMARIVVAPSSLGLWLLSS